MFVNWWIRVIKSNRRVGTINDNRHETEIKTVPGVDARQWIMIRQSALFTVAYVVYQKLHAIGEAACRDAHIMYVSTRKKCPVKWLTL